MKLSHVRMLLPTLLLATTLPAVSTPETAADTLLYGFHQSVIDQNADGVRRGLAEGAPINGQGQSDLTALHLAAARDWPEGVLLLIEQGADRDAPDRYGWRPLHHAAYHGYVRVAEVLLESGATVDAPDARGSLTPLHRAGLNGHAEVVHLLLRHGANPNARSTARRSTGMTPLHWAAGGARAGNFQAVKAMLAAGADVTLADQAGMTALHWAALSHRDDTLEALIAAGAPLDAQEDQGQTSLHMAVSQDRAETVALLVAAGASTSIKDANSNSPKHLAWQASDAVKALMVQPRDNQLPKSGWRFRKDPDDVGRDLGWYRDDVADADWEAIEIETHWESGYVGIGWYRRALRLPERPAALATARLRFEGVDECAQVWVNGIDVGGQDIGPAGWDQPFEVDVADALHWGGDNRIAVRAWNTRGGGGIWRPIVLKAMDRTDRPIAMELE